MFRQNYKIRKDEVMFQVCPFCGNRKWNFEVNYVSGLYHCWVCDRGGHKGWRYLYGIPEVKDAMHGKELESEIQEDESAIVTYSLFDETEEGNAALLFLKDRGLSEAEVDRYVDGYVPFGSYKYRVILMLFDLEGIPASWISRRYTYRADGPKYMIPKGIDMSKPVGFFQDQGDEVLCVEGWFDAVAWRRVADNVCVMRRKKLQYKTVEMLMQRFKNMRVVLDNDADRKDFEFWNELREKTGYDLVIAKMPDARDADECYVEELQRLLPTFTRNNEYKFVLGRFL